MSAASSMGGLVGIHCGKLGIEGHVRMRRACVEDGPSKRLCQEVG